MYHIALPDHETVVTLMEKESFFRFAQEHESRHSANVHPGKPGRCGGGGPRAGLPVCSEAVRTTPFVDAKTSRKKAFRVESPDELLSLYDRVAGFAPKLIAQEWVEGGEGNLFSCNAYFDKASRPLATFVARKIRQWPPETGVSALGEEVRNDEVLAETHTCVSSPRGSMGLGTWR